jgi:hypothetical protein
MDLSLGFLCWILILPCERMPLHGESRSGHTSYGMMYCTVWMEPLEDMICLNFLGSDGRESFLPHVEITIGGHTVSPKLLIDSGTRAWAKGGGGVSRSDGQ